jgi:hypothetical protein
MIQMAVKRCEAVMKRGLCRSLHETLTETRTFRRRLADWYAEIRIWGVLKTVSYIITGAGNFLLPPRLYQRSVISSLPQKPSLHIPAKIHCNPSFIFL